MPFENHGSRAFTRTSIDNNAPAVSGIYGLSNAREWIYIGESDDIRFQLLAHLQSPSAFLSAQNPTGFTFELCAPKDRIARQNRLVHELGPASSRRVGQ